MIRFELSKLRHSRRPWHAAGALGVFLLLVLVGFYTYARSRSGSGVDFRYTFENKSYFNGLTFTVYAFYFGYLMVLPIFVATEGAVQLAGEADAGTLPLLLTRPVGKGRVLLSKWLVTLLYGCVLVFGFLSLSLLMGLVFVGWGDLDLYPGVLQMTSRPQHLPQEVALVRFAWVGLAAGLGLLGPISFAFLVSAWMRKPVNAAAVTVALYLVLHVVGEVHLFEALRPWLFTSKLAYWRGFFQEQIPWGQIAREGAQLAAWCFLFTALAHRRFRLREEL